MPEYAEPRLGELQAITLDPSKAGREIGWSPCTQLADGVAETYEWMRAR